MKIALTTAIFLAIGLGTVSAAPARHVEPSALYTCAGKALSRVSLTNAPSACCDGLMGCPQMLSTTSLIRARRDGRT